MKSVILLRQKLSPVNLLFKYIVRWVMRREALSYRRARNQRMAVFANDEIGTEVFIDGFYEKYHLESLASLIEKTGFNLNGKAFLDVGANIGNHSVYFSRIFERIYAFEPNPDTFHLLSYNLSKIPNSTVFDFGLSDANGQATLNQNEINLGSSSVVFGKKSCSSLNIKLKKLDDIAAGFRQIGFIKIDVEGMELEVLKGASQTILKNKPIIAFEHLHRKSDVGGEDTVQYLQGLGYEICAFKLSNEQQNKFLRYILRFKEVFLGRRLTVSVHYPVMDVNKSHTLLLALPSNCLSKVFNND